MKNRSIMATGLLVSLIPSLGAAMEGAHKPSYAILLKITQSELLREHPPRHLMMHYCLLARAFTRIDRTMAHRGNQQRLLNELLDPFIVE